MTLSFGFSLPTRIEFGPGVLGKAPSLIGEVIRGKRAFIVTDRGIEAAGLVEPLIRGLSKDGYDCTVFNQVQPNRFSDLEYVNQADFPRLAEASAFNGSTPSNCRAITREDYLDLFEEAHHKGA